MIRRVALSLIAAFSIAAAKISHADPVTFYFGGTFFSVPSELSPISVGSVFNGSFTFDSLTIDSEPSDLRFGFYKPAPSFSMNVSGLVFSSSGGGTVGDEGIIIVDGEGDTDDYLVTVEGGITPNVNGFSPIHFTILLTDDEKTAFSNDSLPLTPPNLTLFEGKNLSLIFKKSGDPFGYQLFGPISYLSLTNPIPEPEIYAMLGVGLGLMGWAAKRRKSKEAA